MQDLIALVRCFSLLIFIFKQPWFEGKVRLWSELTGAHFMALDRWSSHLFLKVFCLFVFVLSTFCQFLLCLSFMTVWWKHSFQESYSGHVFHSYCFINGVKCWGFSEWRRISTSIKYQTESQTCWMVCFSLCWNYLITWTHMIPFKSATSYSGRFTLPIYT